MNAVSRFDWLLYGRCEVNGTKPIIAAPTSALRRIGVSFSGESVHALRVCLSALRRLLRQEVIVEFFSGRTCPNSRLDPWAWITRKAHINQLVWTLSARPGHALLQSSTT